MGNDYWVELGHYFLLWVTPWVTNEGQIGLNFSHL